MENEWWCLSVHPYSSCLFRDHVHRCKIIYTQDDRKNTRGYQIVCFSYWVRSHAHQYMHEEHLNSNLGFAVFRFERPLVEPDFCTAVGSFACWTHSAKSRPKEIRRVILASRSLNNVSILVVAHSHGSFVVALVTCLTNFSSWLAAQTVCWATSSWSAWGCPLSLPLLPTLALLFPFSSRVRTLLIPAPRPCCTRCTTVCRAPRASWYHGVMGTVSVSLICNSSTSLRMSRIPTVYNRLWQREMVAGKWLKSSSERRMRTRHWRRSVALHMRLSKLLHISRASSWCKLKLRVEPTVLTGMCSLFSFLCFVCCKT